jgi:hypothetical protein
MKEPVYLQRAPAVLPTSLIPTSTWALEGRVPSMKPSRILHEDGTNETP